MLLPHHPNNLFNFLLQQKHKCNKCFKPIFRLLFCFHSYPSHAYQNLSQLYCESILSAPDIAVAHGLMVDISYMSSSLTVLQQEVAHVLAPGTQQRNSGSLLRVVPLTNVSSVALIIRRQSFPMVIKKNDKLNEQEQLILQLVCPSKYRFFLVRITIYSSQIKILSPVQAQMISDSTYLTRNISTSGLLVPESVALDNSLTAAFRFQFLDGLSAHAY